MGQIRSRDAGQEAAAEAGRITKGLLKAARPPLTELQTTIWGSEVRISSGAPATPQHDIAADDRSQIDEHRELTRRETAEKFAESFSREKGIGIGRRRKDRRLRFALARRNPVEQAQRRRLSVRRRRAVRRLPEAPLAAARPRFRPTAALRASAVPASAAAHPCAAYRRYL